MKKICWILTMALFTISAKAQDKKDWKTDVLNKAGDHFMIQLSSDHWSGAPDSISSRMGGLSRGFNMALMMNKPFKSDPRWSVAFGLGISTSHIFFSKTNVGIDGTTTNLPFTALDSANHFKKYKLATAFLEIPLELRFTMHPQKDKSTWKFAVGAKLGTLLDAHTKGKTL